MLAAFGLKEPAFVALALAVLTGTGLLARTLRQQTGSGRRAAMWRAGAGGLAGLLLGALFVAAGTAGAHALLILLAVGASALLSVESYRRHASKLGRARLAICVAARVGAWSAALLVIGRPAWNWVIVRWEKPSVAVLLDQSQSLGIADSPEPDAPTRAALVNRALDAARPEIGRLEELYDVRLFGFGARCEPLGDWEVRPHAPLSALASALRQAGQVRSACGEPPAAVVLVSDGAENAVSARVVREVAGELAAQRTALLAIGAGPAAELTPAVVLDPLTVPARIGSRDRLRVPVTAHVSGCGGRMLSLALLWGDAPAAERELQIDGPAQQVRTEFEVQPPGVGLHRLTVRVTLPADLGGARCETSAVVDVRDDRIRVLLLDLQPRNEMAFALRAIAGDPRFDVAYRLLMGQGAGAPAGPQSLLSDASGALRWPEYHVVILGNVPAQGLPAQGLAALADAVRDRGVGLLLAGGRDFYHDRDDVRSDLADVVPVAFGKARPPDSYRPRARPTEPGCRHPVLAGLAAGAESAEARLWENLPELPGAARFGQPKPLATVLLAGPEGEPLLAGLDVGRGRVLAAAWDATWPWALASEQGWALHGKLWRQMALWLANRRPEAWVVTDRSTYVGAALLGGQQTLQIRAGLSGADAFAAVAAPTERKARLELRLVRVAPDPISSPPSQLRISAEPQSPGTQPTTGPTGLPEARAWDIPLKRSGGEWRAELPRDLATHAWLTSGSYELLFVVEQVPATGPGAPAPAADADKAGLVLSARTGFTVTATDLELLEPTANLALLRDAAALTEPVGGGYVPLEQLPEALRRLAAQDRRRRVEQPVVYDLCARWPWLLFGLIVGALTVEWMVRKRAGMA